MPPNLLVFLLQLLLGREYKVDQDRPPLTIESQRVLIVALAQHLPGRNARHLFDSSIPGDHVALCVDHKGGIGQEVDDVGQPAL